MGATSLEASLLAAAEPAIPPPSEVLTLGQATTLALQGNRDLKNAALEAGKAEDDLRAVRVQGLPQFNLYATATQMLEDAKVKVPGGAFGDFPGVGPIPATDTEVITPAGRQNFILGQVAQPPTQLRSVSLGTQLKRANLEIALEQLRDKRQVVINDLRRVYYGLLRSQSGPGAGHPSRGFRGTRDCPRPSAQRPCPARSSVHIGAGTHIRGRAGEVWAGTRDRSIISVEAARVRVRSPTDSA